MILDETEIYTIPPHRELGRDAADIRPAGGRGDRKGAW